MTKELSLQPDGDREESIELSPDLIERFGLERWSREFSLMTAGYRDRLDPGDAANPDVPFNLLTVAIMTEAKARVFARMLAHGEAGSVHVGGEVRPHTQAFIQIAARVYAAHGFRVHLRTPVDTTPIWYSSFGIVYEELQSGDNFTASHSMHLKGGWKPLDGTGQQLLAEADDVVAEVVALVKERASIRLAPWRLSGRIAADFDVDSAYVTYQKDVLGPAALETIARAGRDGFKISICPLGGSMGATSRRLLPHFGIATGGGGAYYFLDEEDSEFHGVGQVDGEFHGADPCEAVIYRNVGAQAVLSDGRADLVLLFDPDGDRLKVVTTAPASVAVRAREIGIEIEDVPGSERCIAYLNPNQLYLVLAAARIDALRASGDLEAHDWFVGLSFPTSKSIEELATSEGLRCVRVPVGFKNFGDLCRSLEEQLGGPVRFDLVTGETIPLGERPRAIILCEESGGANMGGGTLLESRSGRHRMLALREKDGMQIALQSIALGARLFSEGSSFVEFYCDVAETRGITHLYYKRNDVRLYDESLLGDALRSAKEAGIRRRDHTVAFFRELVERHVAGELSLEGFAEELEGRRTDSRDFAFPAPTRACSIGDGSMLELEGLRFLLRASGTDALLRYYVEGSDPAAVEAFGQALIALDLG